MLALAGRKRHQFRGLLRAEESLGNVLDIQHRADSFDVDANLAIHRECEEGQIARMRGVELKRIELWKAGCGKSRFSPKTITELDVARRDVEVSSEQNPQSPSREDERSLQTLEPESAGTIRLVLRKKRLEPFDHRIRREGRDRPNVHNTTGEFMLHVSK